MKRKEALALAIDALQKEYKYWLFIGTTNGADKKRVEIAKAIELLDALKRQKELW